MSNNKKPLMLGVAGGVAVILVAGYLYAASKGVEEFEDFLYDNDLSDAIRYQDVSYSPLSDTITMQDVDLQVVVLEFGGQQQKMTGQLESLSIEGARNENKRRVSFSGYELVTNPSASERNENVVYQFLDEPLKFASRLGVRETRLDGSVAYAYDRDDESLALGFSLDAENIASYAMDVTLDRARKVLDTELSEFIVAAVMNPKRQADEFGRVELVSLNANLEDYGFVERLMYMEAISGFNYANVLNNDMSLDAVEAVSQNAEAKREIAEFLDDDSIEVLSAFAAEGGDLKVSVNTKRPVPLAELIKNDKLHRDIKIEVED